MNTQWFVIIVSNISKVINQFRHAVTDRVKVNVNVPLMDILEVAVNTSQVIWSTSVTMESRGSFPCGFLMTSCQYIHTCDFPELCLSSLKVFVSQLDHIIMTSFSATFSWFYCSWNTTKIPMSEKFNLLAIFNFLHSFVNYYYIFWYRGP